MIVFVTVRDPDGFNLLVSSVVAEELGFGEGECLTREQFSSAINGNLAVCVAQRKLLETVERHPLNGDVQ